MRTLLVLISTVCLSGCDLLSKGDPRICGSIGPRINGVAQNSDEQRQMMISCIDHWARRLAQSEVDPAQDVAAAAVTACRDAIQYYVAMSAKEGRPTSGYSEVASYWKDHAHFVAVQSRAGKCALPPA